MAASPEAQYLFPAVNEMQSYYGLNNSDLDKECSRSIRYDIAIKVINWKKTGRYLQIPKEKLVAIQNDNDSEEERRLALLDTWHEREGRRATYRWLINAFLRLECRDLADSLCTMIKTSNEVVSLSGDSSRPEIGTIDILERRFKNLQDQLKSELQDKKVSVDEVLHSLTRLPVDLKFEYDQLIQAKLPTAMKARNITQLFFRLNPLFTFIDYKLIDYLIKEFCSALLKADAASYVKDVESFMRHTTVGDLLPHWPGKKLPSQDFKELWMKISANPQTYTLQKLNELRNRHCANLKLSAILSAIVNLTPAGSFFVAFTVPTVAVYQVRTAICKVNRAFYESEHVVMIILDDKLVYLLDSTEKTLQTHQSMESVTSKPEMLQLRQERVQRLSLSLTEQLHVQEKDLKKMLQLTQERVQRLSLSLTEQLHVQEKDLKKMLQLTEERVQRQSADAERLSAEAELLHLQEKDLKVQQKMLHLKEERVQRQSADAERLSAEAELLHVQEKDLKVQQKMLQLTQERVQRLSAEAERLHVQEKDLKVQQKTRSFSKSEEEVQRVTPDLADELLYVQEEHLKLQQSKHDKLVWVITRDHSQISGIDTVDSQSDVTTDTEKFEDLI